jgi:hypothetical protein
VFATDTTIGCSPKMCFLNVGWAPCLSECDSISDASTSNTIHPSQAWPATCSQGKPCGRAASAAHTLRRWTALAAATRARADSSRSSKTRHTVADEAAGPHTISAWASTAVAAATSVTTCPRS